jgi:hypothetical protein
VKPAETVTFSGLTSMITLVGGRRHVSYRHPAYRIEGQRLAAATAVGPT